ncbi:MAG: DUF1028 domain-containing protein [Ignavibacteriaceae bacterium]|nr:DUF1028 domain-containing protein [Ignavibacteriaceae bacterium]
MKINFVRRIYRIIFSIFLFILISPTVKINGQDTFSIVAVDTVTGEIGSAGASCVGPFGGVGAFILSDVIEGIGAIHTQAYYLAANQINAHNKMLEGLSPQEIIDWLVANDAQGNPTIRQYGIVDLTRNGESASYTGVNCDDYKNHVTGSGYAIQGNILLGQVIIDTMQYAFLNTSGPLADRLMMTLQAAKIIGADTRCAVRGTSSQSSFIKVVRIGDGNTPYLEEFVPDSPINTDPIDLLQVKFDSWKDSLYSTVDPFISTAMLEPDSIPADSVSESVLTISPKNNSDTLLANGLTILLTHTGLGTIGTVTDLGNGTYRAIITSPPVAGTDSISIVVINNEDTVYIATIPIITYLNSTSVEENGFIMPDQFILFQNFPNPFNPSTKIVFRIAEPGVVILKVYDVLGNEVATLVEKNMPAGTHEVEFSNSELTSGLYFYRLSSGEFTDTKKLLLLR